MTGFITLAPGDPAPWFHQRSVSNPRFAFNSVAGRYIVLCFFGTLRDDDARSALSAAFARSDLFDETRAAFFGVSVDPEDESEKRVTDRYPGYRFFWDFDGSVSRSYGALAQDDTAVKGRFRRLWFVLDPTLRIMKVVPFAPDQSDVAAVLDYVAGLPPADHFAGMALQAPILVLPNVFEPDFCARLISLYESQGGEESGFMREVDGKTVGVHDRRHKSRKDVTIEDPALIAETQRRFMRRIAPEIAKVHQFKMTRMERYLVGCYTAEDAGHFAAHRDNTTRGTAHRRFAVSVNLNDDFDGGEVSFPEYGRRGFKAPAGGAVVFSCSLLHAVSQVTRGRRYAFLPFLYDDAAAAIRAENLRFVDQGAPAEKAPAASPAA